MRNVFLLLFLLLCSSIYAIDNMQNTKVELDSVKGNVSLLIKDIYDPIWNYSTGGKEYEGFSKEQSLIIIQISDNGEERLVSINDMSKISSDSIRSIQVLIGGDSKYSALYGSRASYGVFLIKMK